MPHDVVIQPMPETLLLWRCLHSGPLSAADLDRTPPGGGEVDYEACRSRNIPLLRKLTRTYGACALLAFDGGRIVGQLRFYPRAVWNMAGGGELCLQQKPPNGPADDFVDSDFPTLESMDDKTLAVHCLMTGSSLRPENPYQRRGIGSRMVKFLIEWARDRGWKAVEADAFEDLPLIYHITGSAGLSFWRKLGFYVADRRPHPYLQQPSEFRNTLEEQAKVMGISAERARDRIVVRMDL